MAALQRRSTSRAFLTVVIAAMLGLGCVSGDRPRVGTDGETSDEPETIVQMGSNLHGGLFRPSKISIDYEDAVRTGDQRLRVQVNIRNRTGSPLQVQVQTIFKDEEWNPVGEKVDWTLIRLAPRESKPYIAESETPRPELYTVRIRAFN